LGEITAGEPVDGPVTTIPAGTAWAGQVPAPASTRPPGTPSWPWPPLAICAVTPPRRPHDDPAHRPENRPAHPPPPSSGHWPGWRRRPRPAQPGTTSAPACPRSRERAGQVTNGCCRT